MSNHGQEQRFALKLAVLFAAAFQSVIFTHQVLALEAGKLQILVGDEHNIQVPCRIHLYDANEKPVQAPGQPFWRDHFVCPGIVSLELTPGEYRYEIERGPEFDRQSGKVDVAGNAEKKFSVTLKRIANLRASGWYSGDLHVHRSVPEVELLMKAEDLDFAPVITWWNNRNLWARNEIPKQLARKFDRNRILTIMAGEDEREGGALLFFGLQQPLKITGSTRESPSPMKFVHDAHKANKEVWIDIEKPFWWDVPVWLSSGQMNSIGIANNHMCRSQMYENEAWGRPRDSKRLPNPRGNGFWTQEIYYHLLNAGLRIPPSAGSASGVLPNPVGYNRVYVKLDKPFSRDAWFQGLSNGNSFVTNGPILEVTANGHPPGEIFHAANHANVDLNLEMRLTSIDRVAKIEIIRDGAVWRTVDCSDKLRQTHKLKFTAERSGWFLVRAITDKQNTFRFASTAPFYIEIGDLKRPVSRRSAQFFVDWAKERLERVKTNVQKDPNRESILSFHHRAIQYWQHRVDAADRD